MPKKFTRETVASSSSFSGKMPVEHYLPYAPVELTDRRWPDQVIQSPPTWCSVDLRDGNQALVEPMSPATKQRFFTSLVEIGFKQIEVGFPSASEAEFEFVRSLIDGGKIPNDVTVQVLTPARDDLIAPTMRCIQGAHQAIVHLYNSTSELQRRVVFGLDRQGIIDIACRGANRIRELALHNSDTELIYQYSPESFTGTELDFAIEICEAVAEVWEPNVSRPMIVNLPATVEMSTPNVYADQVEYFCRHIRNRENFVISVHPHNDRGTGVAAAELAIMAGADRVEGTLFGNGERTGNVDLVTLGLNLFSQGVDPRLDFTRVHDLVRMSESCTGLPVHPRHPYAGELVFTAFSGSHQDAIRKGYSALHDEGNGLWEVPYLPINPAHVGRGYEPVVRVNSQSGKGGVAFLLEREHGLILPRGMQVEFQRLVQDVAEVSGGEVQPNTIFELFDAEYLSAAGLIPTSQVVCDFEDGPEGQCILSGIAEIDGEPFSLAGCGNGPLEAIMMAFARALPLSLEVIDYSEHALGQGSDAKAVAYVGVLDHWGRVFFGAGCHGSSLRASIEAAVCAIDRAFRFQRQSGARVEPILESKL